MLFYKIFWMKINYDYLKRDIPIKLEKVSYIKNFLMYIKKSNC